MLKVKNYLASVSSAAASASGVEFSVVVSCAGSAGVSVTVSNDGSTTGLAGASVTSGSIVSEIDSYLVSS